MAILLALESRFGVSAISSFEVDYLVKRKRSFVSPISFGTHPCPHAIRLSLKAQ